MKTFPLLSLALLLLFSGCGDVNVTVTPPETSLSPTASVSPLETPVTPSEMSNLTIEVAILLDTSNSMDGLIDQAKSQLWRMVNEFGKARDANGKMPLLHLSLYEYGNDGLPMSENYVRQVTPFITDLDRVSEKLFSLTTNGGSEYAGAVINDAVEALEWSKSSNNLRIILIAGNEPFTQGEENYKEAVASARQKDIIVNTIFCGNYDEGVRTDWKNGALLGGGQYFNIDQDKRIIHIPAPQDDDIIRLNNELNATYFGYGARGKEREMLQEVQDTNASSYGASNLADRAQAKSSKNYVADTWDIVDGVTNGTVELEELKTEDLPEEMQSLTQEEQKAFIEEKKTERENIQKEIRDLSIARDEFIAEKQKEMNGNEETLDEVINKVIDTQLHEKGFTVE